MPPRPRSGGLHLSALRQARDLDSMAAAIVAQSTSDETAPGWDAGKNPQRRSARAAGRVASLEGSGRVAHTGAAKPDRPNPRADVKVGRSSFIREEVRQPEDR